MSARYQLTKLAKPSFPSIGESFSYSELQSKIIPGAGLAMVEAATAGFEAIFAF